MISFPAKWSAIFVLARSFRSLAVAFSAFAGYCAYAPALTLSALYAFTGVLLLSAACAALNQYQEQLPDHLMHRTANRPLPSRSIAPRDALAAAFAFGLAGILVLYLGTTRAAAALGVFNAFWYNVVYTPLKHKTRFAFLIGALAGALPPVIGYVAAGGPLLGKAALIALFMFFWQIPHSMLVLLKFENDYALAGFPSLSSSMARRRFKLTVFLGLLAASISSLLLPLFHVISSAAMIAVLVIANVLFVFYFFNALVLSKRDFNFGVVFRLMYLYLGCMLVVIVGEALMRGILNLYI